MRIEAVARTVRYHLRDGQIVVLAPGQPVDLPDAHAQRLLAQAPEALRPVGTPTAEQAQPAGDRPAVLVEPATTGRPVSWEDTRGRFHGPAPVTYLARVREPDGRMTYWVCVEEGTRMVWVHEDRLRFPQRAEAQRGAVAGKAEARATCARCGGPPPLTWWQGWLTCTRCRTDAGGGR